MSKPVLTSAGAVTVSGHAIDRYVERVKPAYTPKHAHWELARLLPQADLHVLLPEWADNLKQNNAERFETDCFLVLCDSIIFPVSGGIVLTTLVRGSLGPATRRAKTNARKRRHSIHRAIKVSERAGIQRRARKAQGRSGSDWRTDQAA